MAVRNFREFIALESSGGVILFLAAILALIVSNTPLAVYYQALFDIPLSFQLGNLGLSKPLLLWVNEGLMTIFFLLVGLEIKRELFEGELSSMKKAALPAIAAIGGIAVPALVYLYFNRGDSAAMLGWAIPTATDIAFALGIVTLLGSRVPVSIKIFLTAIAIFDDIGAIVIIAIFYTKHISIILLLIAAALIIVLLLLNTFRVTSFGPYVIVGIILWICVLKSGVHATLSGIVLAFAIPLRDPKNPDFSPVKYLERVLHPWVAFGVLPLFAFANAGVSFKGLTVDQFVTPISVGIAAGLFLGKQIGIFGASWLAVKMKWAPMPTRANWLGIYGVSLIAGVGFTMSLFIGTLAFSRFGDQYEAVVRFGVLAGSLLAGMLGYWMLRWAYPGVRHVHFQLKVSPPKRR